MEDSELLACLVTDYPRRKLAAVAR